MDLYIKYQFANLRHVALVIDRNQKPQYYLSGRQGLINDSFSLFSLSNKKIGEIKQMTPGFLPRFDIFIHNRKVGSLTRLVGVWHQFIFVRDLRWLLMGDLLDNHYQAFSHGHLILQVDDAILADGALAHELKITNEADAPICILIAMVLDLWSKNTKKRQAREPVNSGQLIWDE